METSHPHLQSLVNHLQALEITHRKQRELKRAKPGHHPTSSPEDPISLTASGSLDPEPQSNKGWWLSYTPIDFLLTLHQALPPQTELMACLLASTSFYRSICSAQPDPVSSTKSWVLQELPPHPSELHSESGALWPPSKCYQLGFYRCCCQGPKQLDGFAYVPWLVSDLARVGWQFFFQRESSLLSV